MGTIHATRPPIEGALALKEFCVNAFAAGATALLLCGCAGSGETDVDTSRAAEFGFQTSVRTSLIEEGHEAYDMYCQGCHGPEGDGNGPAARFLHPRPRDFQLANYKFSSTRSGQLPTDQDLKRTITEGLRGSAMPGWDLLPTRTVTALVAYLKTFSPKWEERRDAPAIPQVSDPYRSSEDSSAAVARGEVVYHGFATCWTCHPSYVETDKINEHLVAMENPTRDAFRDNLFHAEGKINNEGEIIFPPDFRRDFVRAGASVDDLYRSIGAGITGTAMPTWIDSMEIPKSHGDGPLVQPDDLWAMAYYVQSLVLERPAKFAAAKVQDGYGPRAGRAQEIYAPGEKPPPPPEEPPAETGEEFTDEEFDDE